MFEFVFTQMINTQSYNKFDSSIIFTIKNINGGWPDKFQDIAFKSAKTPTFRMLWSRLSPVKRQKKKKKDKEILLNDVLWLICIRMNHKFILLYVTCINYCKDLNSDNLTLWYGLPHYPPERPSKNVSDLSYAWK